MGLLLLLTSTILFTYFRSGSVVNAQQEFKIQDVTLIIEPSNNVGSGTNVTLKCQATVSTLSEKLLNGEYLIFKDDRIVYTKTTRPSENVLYQLHNARVSNSGTYKCQIKIQGDEKSSSPQALKVKGLSNPVLHLNTTTIDQGEELTASCTAQGEVGSFIFFFFENDKQISRMEVSSNKAVTKFSLSNAGKHKIHCFYKVRTTDEFVSSANSTNITISVIELPITPELSIDPNSGIYEGDRINILCSAQKSRSESYRLFLSQGTKLHSTGNSTINHNMVVVADPPEGLTFDCRVEVRNVEKYDNNTITVAELFSVPTLTMSPTEVFQGDIMALTCESESFARERINREDLIYSLYPSKIPPSSSKRGVFHVKALQNDFNYTCSAEAKGIKKYSKTLMIRPKVLVSTPKISVEDNVILNRTFRIFCQSNGSLPINYTLLKNGSLLGKVIIQKQNQQAVFSDIINQTDKISKYMCEAKNNHNSNKTWRSQNLTVNAIVPLSLRPLIVIPNPPVISEGEDVEIICRVKGTGPVTYKWYRAGSEVPLSANTTNNTHASYRLSALSKNDSDKYHCEASNSANKIRSEEIHVQVHMALWKKALIWGVFLLLASVLVLVASVLYVKSKRVRVDRAEVSVWSKRKPEAGNDDDISKVSSEVSNEPDVEYTEVMHARAADPARVPLRKGTDTVYSELQNSPHGAADHRDYGSVEYAELNHEQLEMSQYHPQVSSYQDLPEPVD